MLGGISKERVISMLSAVGKLYERVAIDKNRTQSDGVLKEEQ